MNQPPIISGPPGITRPTKQCPGCGIWISEEPRFCQYCGKSSTTESRITFRAVFVGAVLFVLGLGALFIFGPNDARSINRGLAREPEYLPSSGRIYEGTQFYIPDTYNKTTNYIGEAVAIKTDHLFPDGTTRAGVSVRFKDGTSLWVPRDAVKKLYLVKNPKFAGN